jgi:hypothetical protein
VLKRGQICELFKSWSYFSKTSINRDSAKAVEAGGLLHYLLFGNEDNDWVFVFGDIFLKFFFGFDRENVRLSVLFCPGDLQTELFGAKSSFL